MKTKIFGLLMTVSLIIVLTVFISAGYIGNESGLVQQKGAVKLAYNYPSGDYVRYIKNSRIVQIMDVQGQYMQVNVNTGFGCSIKRTGLTGDALRLEVRIDTIGQTIDSPQGFGGGSVNSVRGRVINITISRQGKGTDISEAEKLVYVVEGSGETNASQTIIDFFPDLPVNPVKPGETWNSADTTTTGTATMSMRTITQSVNKFEGIVKVDGFECARITSDITGTQTMRTETQGMEVSTSGTFEGKSTLLFALKEGYFIEQDISAKLKGTIDVSGQMTFPLSMETTTSARLVK